MAQNDHGPQPDRNGTPLGSFGKLVLGLYHVFMGGLLIYAVAAVWPPQPWPQDDGKGGKTEENVAAIVTGPTGADASTAPGGTGAGGGGKDSRPKTSDAGKPPSMYFFGVEFNPNLDVRLILLVVVVGALGAFIHSATSFADYVGNRELVASWTWWYLLRPFVGAALAVLMYFVIRAGFVTGTSLPAGAAEAAKFINPFGIAALAGLAGLFTKQATDKLDEVFSTLFKSDAAAKRRDRLSQKAEPTITSIVPPNVAAGAKNVVLKITGANFEQASTVRVGSTTLRPTTVPTATQMEVQLPDTLTAVAATLDVAVVNPGPPAVTSAVRTFTVT